MNHACLALLFLSAPSLAPGDHARSLEVDGLKRTYLVHVPPGYDPQRPTPVVLIFHGAATNAVVTVLLTGLNQKSDQAGFLAVYPEGTGIGPLLFFNSGGRFGPLKSSTVDDVKYVSRLLDDLAQIANVDSRRVFATGLSNGGMMCYRLAAELSDRIAAIAPIAGTMAIADARPQRPVSVMHFHGMADRIVPIEGRGNGSPQYVTYKSLAETIRIWCVINGCELMPRVTDEPDVADDGTTVRRKTYGPGKDGTEVILFEVQGGGHTWPGRESHISLLGKSTRDISANDLMWEFFQRHPQP